MNTRNIIVFDKETTGLFPEKGAEIVQIAAKALNAHDFSDHHAGEFSVILRPEHPELAEAGALKVIGEDLWTRAQTEGVDPKVGLKSFFNWCESVNPKKTFMGKPFAAGQHVKFDIGFSTFYGLKYGLIKSPDDLPWAGNLWIDNQQFAFALFENDPNVENFKLDTQARIFGNARKSDTHDAMEDVRITAEHLRRYMQFFRACKKRMGIAPAASK